MLAKKLLTPNAGQQELHVRAGEAEPRPTIITRNRVKRLAGCRGHELDARRARAALWWHLEAAQTPIVSRDEARVQLRE